MKCKDCKHYTKQTEYKAISVKQYIYNNTRFTCFKNSEGITDANILPERSIIVLPVEDERWKDYLVSIDAIELPNRITGICNKLDVDLRNVNENSDNIVVDAADDHGLSFEVGENFGCIHFEKK